MAPDLRYALALAVAFVVTALLTPLAARAAERAGIVDHPRHDRFHRTPTPYLGGLAVAVGLVLVGGATAEASGQLITILFCALCIAGVGLADDWRGIGPLMKVLVEVGAGVALWLSGVSAGLFGIPALDLALTVLWVVAITNAFNLLDNMDGLASGVTVIAAFTYFVIAASRGDHLVATFAVVIVGTSLGFLAHNFPRAKVFLGDAGALLLGFLVSALALKLDLVGERGPVRALIPALIVGVPVFDMVLVVVTRMRERRPIYVGATDHTSHRLAGLGVSNANVAFALWGSQLIACGIALMMLFGSRRAAWVLAGASTAVALGLLVFALARLAPLRHDRPELRLIARDAAVDVEAVAVDEGGVPDRGAAPQRAGEVSR